MLPTSLLGSYNSSQGDASVTLKDSGLDLDSRPEESSCSMNLHIWESLLSASKPADANLSAKTAYEAILHSPVFNGIPLFEIKKGFGSSFALRDVIKMIGPLPERLEYEDIRETKPLR
jgi:hypothetical protein